MSVPPIVDNQKGSVINKQEHVFIRQKMTSFKKIYWHYLVNVMSATNMFKLWLKEIYSNLYENIFRE